MMFNIFQKIGAIFDKALRQYPEPPIIKTRKKPVHHTRKAYSFVNQNGKTVNVREHVRGSDE